MTTRNVPTRGDIALNFLLNHSDPKVRGAAARVTEQSNRRVRLLRLVQETLGQLRVDLKYLMFDLGCTRRERDALKERLL